MERYQRIQTIHIICFLLRVAAYPIDRVDPDSELKDERHYPNGTVVGTYTYKDKEGNPVLVKYFADDSSYGVELKSFKMDSKLPLTQETQEIGVIKSNIKFNKDFGLFDDKTHPIPKSDFEIYMENEIKPEKCGKEKVRVYHDKNKRKIRNAIDETLRLCQAF